MQKTVKRQARKKFTIQDDQTIRSEWSLGTKVSKIAEILNRDPSEINFRVKDLCLPYRNQPVTDEDRKQIVALRAKGLKLEDIATQTGRNVSVVHRVLKKAASQQPQKPETLRLSPNMTQRVAAESFRIKSREKQEILSRIASGRRLADIIRETGRSRSTINRLRKNQKTAETKTEKRFTPEEVYRLLQQAQ